VANKNLMETDPTANATEHWIVSIFLGGMLGAVQNWVRSRSQRKAMEAQTEKLLGEMKPPIPTHETEDLRDALRKLSELQQEQHAANIVRISQLETQYGGINSDIQDMKIDGQQIRKELEGVRTENRSQTQILQSVLSTVLAIRDKKE
jgi:hypothetical protein